MALAAEPTAVHTDEIELSVVMPCLNEARTVGICVAKAVRTMRELGITGEVLVVDNGSTDGSAAFLAESFPRVKVVALDRNLGFGGGSNAGFRAARNDIVVLLNSDMRVDPGHLPLSQLRLEQIRTH